MNIGEEIIYGTWEDTCAIIKKVSENKFELYIYGYNQFYFPSLLGIFNTIQEAKDFYDGPDNVKLHEHKAKVTKLREEFDQYFKKLGDDLLEQLPLSYFFSKGL